MSEDAPTPDENRSQFKVKLEDSTFAALEAQRAALGFYSGNQLSAVYIHAFSQVPPEKVYEALALVRRYASKNPPTIGKARK